MQLVTTATFLVLLLLGNGIQAAELRGSAGMEARLFTADATQPGPVNEYSSLVIKPEFIFYDESGDHSLIFTPFYRLDSHDSERSHGDIRELYWLYQGDRFEISAGIRRVFWGTTESQHLVDVINQTDLVENLDTEDKLGQPMVSSTWLTDMGVFEFYFLPRFRQRTFPADDGRLQFIPGEQFSRKPQYESKDEEQHLDWALRWSNTFGYWDIGVSHFYGTNREPLFIPDINKGQLHPYYELMHQTGLDVQGAVGAWLWKLEAIHRDTNSESFTAATAGFEYTWYQVGQSSMDIGLVMEYLYDGRKINTSAFKDDLMLGLRLSPNDLLGSEFLLGIVRDEDGQGSIYRLEAGRRITDQLRIDLEATIFSGLKEKDIFYNLRDDDFIQLQVDWYF